MLTGDQLRARRIALGLTQEQFAEILGTRQQHIHRWESGKRPITVVRAGWFESYLGQLEAAQRRKRVPRGTKREQDHV